MFPSVLPPHEGRAGTENSGATGRCKRLVRTPGAYVTIPVGPATRSTAEERCCVATARNEPGINHATRPAARAARAGISVHLVIASPPGGTNSGNTVDKDWGGGHHGLHVRVRRRSAAPPRRSFLRRPRQL